MAYFQCFKHVFLFLPVFSLFFMNIWRVWITKNRYINLRYLRLKLLKNKENKKICHIFINSSKYSLLCICMRYLGFICSIWWWTYYKNIEIGVYQCLNSNSSYTQGMCVLGILLGKKKITDLPTLFFSSPLRQHNKKIVGLIVEPWELSSVWWLHWLWQLPPQCQIVHIHTYTHTHTPTHTHTHTHTHTMYLLKQHTYTQTEQLQKYGFRQFVTQSTKSIHNLNF